MSQSSAPQDCPICAESFGSFGFLSPQSNASQAVSRPCCGNVLCQGCLYQHIQSVFAEGITGDGRSSLKCPFGCGSEIRDSDICLCLKRNHANLLWTVVGTVMLNLLRCLTWYRHQDPLKTSRYHAGWEYWTKTPAERRDLVRYEQWCMSVALRRPNGESEVIMRCPAPDCGYAWIANQHNRRSKIDHENRRSWLFYKPPPPERAVNPFWVVAEYLDPLQEIPDASRSDERDGRRMICAKCHCVFCGVCQRPWEAFFRKRRSHAGITCRAHARHCRDSEYAFVAQIAHTKSCPGCSLRVSRVDGCNHMTCPCGFEWCYVCECRWNVTHYSCVERRHRERAVSGWCVIS